MGVRLLVILMILALCLLLCLGRGLDAGLIQHQQLCQTLRLLLPLQQQLPLPAS